jgi:hypothetical protein
VQKTRKRVINFRVTEEQYSRLKSASDEGGARCLSEYARDVLMRSLDGDAGEKPGTANGIEKMLTLELRLGIVELSLSRLEGRMYSLTNANRDAPLAMASGM